MIVSSIEPNIRLPPPISKNNEDSHVSLAGKKSFIEQIETVEAKASSSPRHISMRTTLLPSLSATPP